MKRLGLTIALALMSASVAGAGAPGPPQNLAALVAGNTVTLTWLAPTTGGLPSSYVVEASLSPGGVLIASLAASTSSLVVPDVPNAIYYVRVRALNAHGGSAPSNEVIVVVPGGGPGCAFAPDAPTNLVAAVSGSLVELNWTAAVTGCPATGYIVQAGSASGLSDIAVINVGPNTSLSVSAPVATYFVRVVATNAFGGSAASNEIAGSVTTTFVTGLSGFWSGTSNYFNAPFAFELVQTGNRFSGRYRDRHDLGFVSGTVNGNHIVLDVTFGDTGIRFEGTVQSANRIRGTIRGSVIGGVYVFEMTR
jgi:hypothetical protein